MNTASSVARAVAKTAIKVRDAAEVSIDQTFGKDQFLKRERDILSDISQVLANTPINLTPMQAVQARVPVSYPYFQL